LRVPRPPDKTMPSIVEFHPSMKTLCAFSVILLLGPNSLSGQSLQELLVPKGAISALSSNEADEAWKQVLAAFRSNDAARAVEEGRKFLVGDFTPSALQLLGVKVMLSLSGEATTGTTFESREDQKAYVKLQADRASITQQYNELQSIVRQNDAVINELTMNRRRAVQQGSSNYFACMEASRKMELAMKELEALKAPIENNKREMSLLESKSNNSIKPMTMQLLDGLIEAGQIEAAVAVSSTYIRKIGNDFDVAMKQQDIALLQEAYEKVEKVIGLLKTELDPLLAGRKFWEAERKQEAFARKVESMTADKHILSMVKKRISADPFELERHKVEAGQISTLIIAKTKLDSDVAIKEFVRFAKDYPDYPQLKDLEFAVTKTSIKSDSTDKMVADLKREIEPLLAQRRFWESLDLQKRFLSKMESISESAEVLGIFRAKVSADPFGIEREMAMAQQAAQLIKAEAKLDSGRALQNLMAFIKDYPDYPQLKDLEFSIRETKAMSSDALLTTIEVEFEELKQRMNPEKLQLRVSESVEGSRSKRSNLKYVDIRSKQSETLLAELGVAPADVAFVMASLSGLLAGVKVLESADLPAELRGRLEILKSSVEALQATER